MKLKKGFKGNIERATMRNKAFRAVLYTADHLQLVLMSLEPRQEIGTETHAQSDQFFRFESGTARVVINRTTYAVSAGDAIIVPRGATHNITNTSRTKPLKLYTIYAPPHHADGILQKTRADALSSAEIFRGVTTE